MDKFFDDIANFLKSNPAVIGAFIALIGLFLFLASVLNWNWIFGDINPVNYSPGKIDGLVNFFGRKAARIIVGICSFFILLCGFLIIGLSLKK